VDFFLDKEDDIYSGSILFLFSSYYKKILAKQHEMNQGSGTIEYLHNPRFINIF